MYVHVGVCLSCSVDGLDEAYTVVSVKLTMCRCGYFEILFVGRWWVGGWRAWNDFVMLGLVFTLGLVGNFAFLADFIGGCSDVAVRSWHVCTLMAF